jgi:penicillin-binding protein 1A
MRAPGLGRYIRMPDDQRRRRQRPPRRPSRRPSSERGTHLAAVPEDGGGSARLRLNKARLALTLLLLSILAVVSTVFGMMMAVAQDLPELESQNEFKAAKNSILLDASGKRQLAVLTGENNRILVPSGDISQNVKRAVIAIEDQRFYKHKGVDYRGIARALWADVRRQHAVQGASTITQQFVKNALLAQQNRSIFQKLKEAALAYQLERKWTKDKILTEYLNTVYFGSGAYGVESAARVYFGWNHPGCEPHCAAVLEPTEAALLAGMIASPSGYSPIDSPAAALERRDLVLRNMRDQYLLAPSEYQSAIREALPPRNRIEPPKKVSKSPYFSSWVEDQLVKRYGTGNTFGGGLKIRTTLDLDFQAAAEQAINGRLAGVGPSAALVAIDNKSGGVRAMVGGGDFQQRPFNLATQGLRQPGSAFKPFTLIAALEDGISPGRTFVSAPKVLEGPRGEFKVKNYNDSYAGVTTLAGATTTSDNSVYAEIGYKLVGTSSIAHVARRMGVRTPISRNPAMVLGGLKVGVTPLEMAKSYETLAHNGERVSGTLAPYDGGPVTFTKVTGPGVDDHNHLRTKRIIPDGVAQEATSILQSVVTSGTGRNAAIGEFAAGKTGTTENYQDAWFVGFNDMLTVAVWVGYPEGAKPMETEYHGEPVAGGTFPADIWHDFMLSVRKISDARAAESGKGATGPSGATGPVAPVAPPVQTPAPQEQKPSKRKTPATPGTGGGAPTDGGGGGQTPAPQPEPQTPAEPPAPPAQPPPAGGGTGGAAGGAGGAGPAGGPGQ